MHPKLSSFFQKLLATEEALVPIFVTSDPLAQEIAAIVITTTSLVQKLFPGAAPAAPAAPATPAA